MDKLHLNEHISRQFNVELEEVRSQVLHMGGIVEEQLSSALKVLVSGDKALAKEVALADASVNALEVDIDEECTRILALRQPAASDLRLVMTVVKIINELERIGDEAKRVAKMSSDELDGVLSEGMRTELTFMGALVRDMLRQVLDGFARADVDTAIEVVKSDRLVDKRYKKIVKQFIQQMINDPASVPSVLKVLWAVRSLERLGDRCQNIAEHIIYMALGTDIRHIKLDDVLAEIETQE